MITRNKLAFLFSVALSLSAFSIVSLQPSAFGQAISANGGSIAGTITDPSGAALANAEIVLKSTEMGFTKTVDSDSAGFFSIGPLTPGSYTVTITDGGFETLTVTTVIRTGTVTSGNFKLTIGQSSQNVVVNAGALQVNTDQIGVSDVITREQIDSLPINGRNFLDVAQIQPGVILQSGETFDPTKAGYSAISVGGVSGRTTRILLDGQDITDETVGTTIMNVTTGAIDEFQLNRSTQDVSGEVTSTGQVLVSTRSGTNGFHGQLLYNFQDHRAGFAATTGGFDAPFQRNQFGGSIGGPIWKDKLFFFVDSERIKQFEEASASISSTFATIQAAYPYIPAPFRETYSTGRIDYNAPKGIHLFARVAYDVNSDDSNFADLYSLYQSRNNVPAIVGGADFTTGHFTHSIRGGYEKFHNLLQDGVGSLASIYNPNLVQPGINITLLDGQDNFYAGPNYLAPQGTYQSDKQLRYDATWTKGEHTFKFGASMNRLLGGGFAAFYGPSLYTVFGAAQGFGGPATPGDTTTPGCGGVAGAQPCLGDPLNGYSAEYYVLGNGNGSFTEKPGFGLPGGGLEDWRSGAYVADNWKLSQYFTVNLGLRWSIDTDRANQDLPTPLCSSVDPGLQFPGCTGNTPLFDQYQLGLGKKTHQPYANFGPQAGFVWSPGDHKTAVRGGIGIFYESDIFNNTSNARTGSISSNGAFFNYTGICGPFGTAGVNIPGGGTITGVGGVPFSTICNEPISEAAPIINGVKAQYQAASAGTGPNPGFVGTGNGLYVNGLYAAPYVTPYSIQINGGFQREIAKGTILSVDYVHNGTLKIPLTIDVNHVGAARYLNVAAAQAAIASTLSYCNAPTVDAATAPGGCAPSATPGSPAPTPFAADITTFAGQGLDSGNQFSGSYAYPFFGETTPAAFAGGNPNVGAGKFILPVGRSQYNALQVVVKQQVSHPLPGIVSSNFQASYSFSKAINPSASTGTSGSADQFFNGPAWDNDQPNLYNGRSSVDHTNELSFGGSAGVKYGLNLGVIGHFYSAGATSLTLDNTSGASGEIFRTDITGDGTTGDLLPGTSAGAYMHEIKGAGLNKAINNYNSNFAGQLTPAGQALVSAGLLTTAQLVALNGVQQLIAPVPGAHGVNNSAFRGFDANVSYPIRFSKFSEKLSIEPGVAIYNVANMSNFGRLAGTLASASTAANYPDNLAVNFLNGPDDVSVTNSVRTQRGSGTFSQGAPRTTEFQLRVNF